jgi:molybdopterin synthase sulfur carrier subunit
MVKIRFPSAMQPVTKAKEKEIHLEGGTVRDVFQCLVKEFGQAFENRIFEGENIRRFINVFVNGEDIRHLQGLETRIKDSDEISILPAVSGG